MEAPASSPPRASLALLLLVAVTTLAQAAAKLPAWATPISEFPQPHESLGFNARFINFRNDNLLMYWDDGSPEGVYNGELHAKANNEITSYSGHAFKIKYREGWHKGELVTHFVMDNKQQVYIVHPAEDDTATLESEEYKAMLKEAEFLSKYQKENGRPWLSPIGRDLPRRFIWPAPKGPGTVHQVKSEFGYYNTDEDAAAGFKLPVNLKLEALSTPPDGPMVYAIHNLLSEFECDHIVKHGKQVIRKSTVGSEAFTSDSRTSSTGWLSRKRTEILDNLYGRMADVLKVDNSQLHSGTNGVAEDLQIVRYKLGQQYMAHYDFGQGDDKDDMHDRFMTLLLYISPSKAGGGTSFPKALGGRGLQVRPPKGTGILFYDMLPDGNADDLSLHSGMPVHEGVKWLCNLWVWDPALKGSVVDLAAPGHEGL